MAFLGFGCKHSWKIVKDETMESAAEQADVANKSGVEAPSWMFKKKSITILECKKCGKLDKTVERLNP